MKLSNLATVLRAAGLTVHETAGWSTRGYAGQDLAAVRGVLWHHTATNRTAFDRSPYPTRDMCLAGRPDLPGPLCNILFDRNGHVHLIAAGVANHAGHGAATNVPSGQGNHYLIGIEMESSGIAPWDWTAEQIRIAPILGAALERAYLMALPAEQRLQISHQEYGAQTPQGRAVGKIDPAGWPGGMDGLRASINDVLGAPAPAPAPKPAAPAPAPKPARIVQTRTIIGERAMYRIRPDHRAPAHPSFPNGFTRGARVDVDAFTAGTDPYGTGDDAWYRGAHTGGWFWSNNLSGGLDGLPRV